jgi:hypothetical protein
MTVSASPIAFISRIDVWLSDAELVRRQGEQSSEGSRARPA